LSLIKSACVLSIICILISLCGPGLQTAKAQSAGAKYVLHIQAEPADKAVLAKLRYKKNHSDSLRTHKEVQELLRAARAEAYLTASADTLYWQGDTLQAYIYLGPKYRWAQLQPGNLPDNLLNRAGYKERFYTNKPFSYTDLIKLEERLLSLSEDQGYPFAAVKLDSVTLQEDQVTARLWYEQGPAIRFDSIKIRGDINLKARFLSRYLRIMPGDPYNQQKVESAVRLLRQVPYLRVAQPPAVYFANNKAEVELFLNNRKVNQLDGIIGFLPNEEVPGRVLITGEFNMHLQNLFASGKSLKANWQKMRAASQKLDLEYAHPAFLGSPIEVKGAFHLLKEDTTFLNTNGRLSLGYFTHMRGKFSVHADLQSSRLTANPAQVSSRRAELAAYNLASYGVGYEWNNLDDYFYPHRGWRIAAEASAGNRRLRRLPSVEEHYYDSLQMNSLQVSTILRVEHYLRLSGRSVVLTSLRGGYLHNNNLFLNDLFRLGGLQTLRGFNENNFFASRYAVGTLEYRFFTDESSYLLLFADQGILGYDLRERSFQDQPFGIGAGISFSTAAGIFNFIYSLGNAKDQKLLFNQSKIHFGLISRF
jgi:translocation and assembly module TamA